MPRPDTYPRAKALVRKAKIENPDLKPTSAMEMLEERSKLELRQVAEGEQLADQSAGFPLIVPGSVKTISRWIADVPKSEKWDARSSSPADFRVIARVFRELVARSELKTMLTQAEAENIAWVEAIAPGKAPRTLLATARMLIALEGVEGGKDAVTNWLVFSVEDSPDKKNYPGRDWLNTEAKLPGVEFHTAPQLYMDIYRLKEELNIWENPDD
jgi:hypothetical protein